MKRLILITGFLFIIMNVLTAQSLKKDCVICIHTIEFTPNSWYERTDVLNFLSDKYYPAFAKETNCEIKLSKGLNREVENKMGVIFYYTSKAHFNAYWNDDGSATEKGQKAIDNMNALNIELREMGQFEIENLQDWVVLN